MVTETMTLWRPTGPQELDLVRASGWKAWPARLPDQSRGALSETGSCRKDLYTDGSTSLSTAFRYGRYASVIRSSLPNLSEITSLVPE